VGRSEKLEVRRVESGDLSPARELDAVGGRGEWSPARERDTVLITGNGGINPE
jgi:hypothetical protein